MSPDDWTAVDKSMNRACEGSVRAARSKGMPNGSEGAD